jgi:branched-chain amino acid transport system substrate-binding protein
MMLTRWTAGAGIALALATSVVSAQEKPPIKLAHTAPLSGIIAQTGQLQAMAVDLSVADVNAAGGINGSKLEIVRYDDQLKPDQAVLRIREAIGAGAVGIIGPVSGTQWETAAPLVNQLKFPAININASKPGITVRPWALRIANNDGTGMPEVLADFVKHYPNVKKVVVMGDVREASGKAAVALWADLAKARGIEVLDTIAYTTGTTDFSPTALKVKELKPDAILLSTVAPDALRLGRELQAQGVHVPVLANSLIWPGTLPQALTKTIGKDAALWHTAADSTNDFSTGDQVLYKKFVQRYTDLVMKDSAMAQFPPPNVANATQAYDVVSIVADILRKKGVDGNTPPEKAREALKDGFMELKSFVGLNKYEIRDNGDAYLPTRAVHVDPARSMWVFLD